MNSDICYQVRSLGNIGRSELSRAPSNLRICRARARASLRGCCGSPVTCSGARLLSVMLSRKVNQFVWPSSKPWPVVSAYTKINRFVGSPPLCLARLWPGPCLPRHLRGPACDQRTARLEAPSVWYSVVPGGLDPAALPNDGSHPRSIRKLAPGAGDHQ